jgi:hypothetical protein
MIPRARLHSGRVQEIDGPGDWPVLFFGDRFIRRSCRITNRSKAVPGSGAAAPFRNS